MVAVYKGVVVQLVHVPVPHNNVIKKSLCEK